MCKLTPGRMYMDKGQIRVNGALMKSVVQICNVIPECTLTRNKCTAENKWTVVHSR